MHRSHPNYFSYGSSSSSSSSSILASVDRCSNCHAAGFDCQQATCACAFGCEKDSSSRHADHGNSAEGKACRALLGGVIPRKTNGVPPVCEPGSRVRVSPDDETLDAQKAFKAVDEPLDDLVASAAWDSDEEDSPKTITYESSVPPSLSLVLSSFHSSFALHSSLVHPLAHSVLINRIGVMETFAGLHNPCSCSFLSHAAISGSSPSSCESLLTEDLSVDLFQELSFKPHLWRALRSF